MSVWTGFSLARGAALPIGGRWARACHPGSRLVAAGWLALAAALLIASNALAGPPAAAPRATPAADQQFFPAVLLAGRTALIKSQFDERVADVVVRVGTRVEQGAVLLRLRDDEERIEQDRAAAALVKAKADAQRARDLHARDGTSQEEADRVELILQSAQADLDLARIHFEERTITAPYAGIVAERYVDPGTSVEAGDPLVRVTALSPLRLEALLPEAMLHVLSKRAVVEIHPAFPDTILQIPVRLGTAVVDPASGMFPLQIEIDNARNRLTPGVSCRIAIVPGRVAP